MEKSDIAILAEALTSMARALENLADSQRTITEEVSGIKNELRGQTKTLALSITKQKQRAAEIMEAARKVSKHAPTPSR